MAYAISCEAIAKKVSIYRVGGPVGETNFKFFIQFTAYSALYFIFTATVMAIYVHRQVNTKVWEPIAHNLTLRHLLLEIYFPSRLP